MNNPDHIYERLKTIFWVKILKFFDVDPGWKNSDPGFGMEKVGSGIRDKHPGSATLVDKTKLIFMKHFFIIKT